MEIEKQVIREYLLRKELLEKINIRDNMDTSTLKSHQFKDTLTTNPHERGLAKHKGKDRDEWIELRDKLLEDMESKLIEIDGQSIYQRGQCCITDL